jgi:hypothetical protein
MSKTDPVGEQRVSDKRLRNIVKWKPESSAEYIMAKELIALRTQSSAAAEEKCKHCGEGIVRHTEYWHANGAEYCYDHEDRKMFPEEPILAAPAAAVEEEKP